MVDTGTWLQGGGNIADKTDKKKLQDRAKGDGWNQISNSMVPIY
jgi:hypothetical protein